MDESRLSKWLSLHSRGIITATEFANSLLSALASDDADLAAIGSLMADLPEDVQQEVQILVHRIRDDHFIWIPFRIGPGEGAADPVSLRRICAILEHSPVKAG